MSKPIISTIPLSDETQVPWLAYGTGSALFGTNIVPFVTLALQSGFTHLDGAQMYANEDTLGTAILSSSIPRSSLYITTKLAPLDLENGQTVEQSLRDSLKKLKMDYVNLFLIHAASQHQQYVGRIGDVWKDMVECKKKGLTRSIGVSNFNIQHLREIEKTGLDMPVVNQIEYHLFLFSHPPIKSLVDYHAKHKIITGSYGGLTPILPNRSETSSLSLNTTREALKVALDKARERRGDGVTQNQIVLKWLQQKGVLAVTTSTKESRIKEYLSVGALPDLTPEEINEIEKPCMGVYHRHFQSTPRMFGVFKISDYVSAL